MWKSIEEKGFWHGELWNYRKNSELFSEVLNISVLKDNSGKVSHYVGVFSENTMFKKLQHKQHRERKNASLRANLSHTLQQGYSFKQRIEKVLSILCQFNDLKVQQQAGIFLLSDEGSTLKMFVTHGKFSDEFILKEQCINIGSCLCGGVADSGLLKISDDCFTDHNHEHSFENMVAHGHYIVPLKYANRVLGILFLYTEPYPSREPERIELLSSIGEIIGLAISNEQAHEALREEKKVAEKANKAKTEFLSSMSHELRTPLNAILGFSQLLESDPEYPLNEIQQESVDYISSGGKHLLNLINEVLELSAIEAGKINISIESINLRNIVNDCLLLVQNTATQKNITINILNDDQDTVLQADNTKFKQVLLNLFSNAIKYNKDNGSLNIDWSLVENQNLVNIRIIDTGLGISKDNQEIVFSPFNRLGKEHSVIEGTGIGLVVTKNLVELMDGTMGFNSVEGEGTTFWIQLPLLESPNKLNI